MLVYGADEEEKASPSSIPPPPSICLSQLIISDKECKSVECNTNYIMAGRRRLLNSCSRRKIRREAPFYSYVREPPNEGPLLSTIRNGGGMPNQIECSQWHQGALRLYINSIMA